MNQYDMYADNVCYFPSDAEICKSCHGYAYLNPDFNNICPYAIKCREDVKRKEEKMKEQKRNTLEQSAKVLREILINRKSILMYDVNMKFSGGVSLTITPHQNNEIIKMVHCDTIKDLGIIVNKNGSYSILVDTITPARITLLKVTGAFNVCVTTPQGTRTLEIGTDITVPGKQK